MLVILSPYTVRELASKMAEALRTTPTAIEPASKLERMRSLSMTVFSWFWDGAEDVLINGESLDFDAVLFYFKNITHAQRDKISERQKFQKHGSARDHLWIHPSPSYLRLARLALVDAESTECKIQLEAFGMDR
jgi:hypothetical protein